VGSYRTDEVVPGGETYYLLQFDRPVEAAAFVAALSRVLDSPRGGSAVGRDSAVEVWGSVAAGRDAVTLYLTPGALEAAGRAFSPVPVAATCPGDALPSDAVLILDGRVRHAMGLEEAERLFLTP
jgi:hypothetical protein